MPHIYSYKPGSASAKALADSLGILRIKHDHKRSSVRHLINWGASSFKKKFGLIHCLNWPENVKLAVNKLETFKALQGHCTTPSWTESREEASRWLAEGFRVVTRLTLTGHSGEGILITHPHDEEPLEEAPLYTKYIPKRNEYRLHVFDGEVFFEQRKARKKDVPNEEINWQIRNHANGFIFAHQDVILPDAARLEAIRAVDALGLDFGAVDLVHGIDDVYYVLEVNTACGLEGETLIRYTKVFNEYMWI